MRLFEKIKNLIFPSHLKCDICGREIEKSKGVCLCDKCLTKLPFIFHGCTKCGEKIDGEYNVCFSCKQNLRDFDKCFSVFEYDGLSKDMVRKLKYDGEKFLSSTMANFLTDYIINHDVKFDILTCVPISRKTRKERGYNQAELLAKNVAKNLQRDVFRDLLIRVKENISQVELSAHERAKNIENSFVVIDKKMVKGKTILVIDDVLTTGSTMNEIAKVLKKAGASKVFGLTFANTTRKIKFEEENNQIPTKSEI